MDDKQLERFGEAVEEKNARAKAASEEGGSPPPSGPDASGDQPDLSSPARPQDATSVRAKNSGKGKKTADKWNQ